MYPCSVFPCHTSWGFSDYLVPVMSCHVPAGFFQRIFPEPESIGSDGDCTRFTKMCSWVNLHSTKSTATGLSGTNQQPSRRIPVVHHCPSRPGSCRTKISVLARRIDQATVRFFFNISPEKKQLVIGQKLNSGCSARCWWCGSGCRGRSIPTR